MLPEIQAIGNLGQDAEIKEFNGTKYLAFKVGCSEKYTGSDGVQREKTEWISCLKAVRNEQSKLAQFLKKGTQVMVRGRVSSRAFEATDPATKQKVWVSGLNCNVDKLQLLGSPRQSDQQNPQQPMAVQNAARPQYPQSPVAPQQPVMMPTNDDDLPF